MRIAVVTSSYPAHREDPSGHFVRAEVRLLTAQGHRVTLLAPKATARPSEGSLSIVQLPHLGLFGWPGALERVKRCPPSLVGVLPFVHAARRALVRTGPYDAVIAHWLVPGFWPIARDFGGETTVVAHGSDVRLLERLPSPLQRRILTGLIRPKVALRCVSSELAARLRRLAGAHRFALERVTVSPCAIETPTLPAKAELRRTLGMTAAPLVVVVGRVVKDKQIPLAIAATEQGLGVTLTVIGDGPERAALMKRYPQVNWLGQRPRSETLRWIKAADLLLSASELEGAPTVIREARALDTRVVAVNAGDLRLWAATDPGLFVVTRPSADPHDLTVALAQALRAVMQQLA